MLWYFPTPPQNLTPLRVNAHALQACHSLVNLRIFVLNMVTGNNLTHSFLCIAKQMPITNRLYSPVNRHLDGFVMYFI